jgi:hypothetical protein
MLEGTLKVEGEIVVAHGRLAPWQVLLVVVRLRTHGFNGRNDSFEASL